MALPLLNYHSYEAYVSDLARAEQFYTKALGFKVIGRSTPQAQKAEGMERLVLAGGKTIHLILSKPTADFSVAAQYLKTHPEGIAFLNFRVKNLDKACQFLRSRKATFLYDPVQVSDEHGTITQVAMATALDDVNFRMIDDEQYSHFGPNFEITQQPGTYASPYGFECIDHFTCNVRTLQPLISFYKEVLGFEEFWKIDFHTNDVSPNLPVGSGLKSMVMWHPDSGIKFANNEPASPYFRNSQIDIYCRDNLGSGIQHAAFRVPDITKVVGPMRERGVKFLDAPPKYYEMLGPRLKKTGFTGKINEDIKVLQKDSILIDASEKGYLLQIFSLELSRIFADQKAGALFYEIIQREGDDGFGGGNFRALFETIEIDQQVMHKTASQLPLELI